MAIVIAIKKWHHYIDGKCTRVVTNHEPLKYLQTYHQLSSCQVRWLEFLQTFKLDFLYHPGKEAHVPDFLCRIVTVVVEPGWLG